MLVLVLPVLLLQDMTDTELLALAGPSQGHLDPALRLSSVVADSARRWLAATDEDTSSNTSEEETNDHAKLDDEAVAM